jgi:carboxypeptidase Q
MTLRSWCRLWSAAVVAIACAAMVAANAGGDRNRLVAALLGPTPLVDDVEALSDRIGGRATGSEANRRAVSWSAARLTEAGVTVRRESFRVSAGWLERSARAEIRGEGVTFAPRVAAMPFSTPTGPDGVSGPLVDGGRGAEEDFARLGATARGAFVLIEQDELADVDGLFREYNESAAIEQRARAAGAAGVAYMSSRASGLLYRHNVAIGASNTRPMVVIERDAARRAQRLIRHGASLALTLWLDVALATAATADNVVAEIPGVVHPEDIVLMGAHLDSWDLGAGTLDNGANAMLLVDIARQIVRLGLRPARTIRLVLWNGEEVGMLGSYGYVQAHAAELDHHIVAGAIDIGCGKATGFYTNGRPDLVPVVDRLLAPLGGLGPFAQVDVPVVGTDNFDFMLEGVPNLIANQESARYGPSYHAANDQMGQCDMGTVRLNAAIVGGLVWGFAEDGSRLPRHTHADVQALMNRTDLAEQMKTFNLWDGWANGTRGRRP